MADSIEIDGFVLAPIKGSHHFAKVTAIDDDDGSPVYTAVFVNPNLSKPPVMMFSLSELRKSYDMAAQNDLTLQEVKAWMNNKKHNVIPIVQGEMVYARMCKNGAYTPAFVYQAPQKKKDKMVWRVTMKTTGAFVRCARKEMIPMRLGPCTLLDQKGIPQYPAMRERKYTSSSERVQKLDKARKGPFPSSFPDPPPLSIDDDEDANISAWKNLVSPHKIHLDLRYSSIVNAKLTAGPDTARVNRVGLLVADDELLPGEGLVWIDSASRKYIFLTELIAFIEYAKLSGTGAWIRVVGEHLGNFTFAVSFDLDEEEHFDHLLTNVRTCLLTYHYGSPNSAKEIDTQYQEFLKRACVVNSDGKDALYDGELENYDGSSGEFKDPKEDELCKECRWPLTREEMNERLCANCLAPSEVDGEGAEENEGEVQNEGGVESEGDVENEDEWEQSEGDWEGVAVEEEGEVANEGDT